MRRIISLLFLFFAFTQTNMALDAMQNPTGYWKTIDDVTGQPKAIIKISESKDKTLVGKIMKVYFSAENNQTVCTACLGNKHNQPIIGMTILEKLAQNKSQLNEWKGGRILDPKNGKEYRCLIQLVDQGQKLNVRGYLGISLFGRSQTWLRMTDVV